MLFANLQYKVMHYSRYIHKNHITSLAVETKYMTLTLQLKYCQQKRHEMLRVKLSIANDL